MPQGEGADAEISRPRSSGLPRNLREMAEREPERARAMERFKNEGTEESWRTPNACWQTARFEAIEASRLGQGLDENTDLLASI